MISTEIPDQGRFLLQRRSEVVSIVSYFALLALLMGIGDGLATLPVMFFLKTTLHLSALSMAKYNAIVATPTYVGFVFGIVRDRLRPFGKGDRGYMFLTMPVIACLYVYLSFGSLSYTRILCVMLTNGLLGNMLGAAISGLKIAVGQSRLMTGRLAAMIGMFSVLPGVVSALAGGWLTHYSHPQTAFALCGSFYVLASLVAFWAPPAIFQQQQEWLQPTGEDLGTAIRRMIRHRPLWSAVAIVMLFACAPGWGTPLFYYLTNRIHIGAEQYGIFQACGVLATACSSVLYGLLCRRLSLQRILWASTLCGTIGSPLYLLIHSFNQALLISVLVSALLGIAYASYVDLLLRSYPHGLGGTGNGIMVAVGTGVFAGCNILGSWLYERGGFGLDLAITTLTTALILLVLLTVPHEVVATCDGEKNLNC